MFDHPHHLDPTDWTGFRRQSHQMLDDILDYVADIDQRPVWQPAPPEVRAEFQTSLPREPISLADAHAKFMQLILPYSVGNAHPGFMGWVHGGGTVVGMLAEMLAAGVNANLGGRNHIPIAVEQQVVRWMRDLFGFPEHASGLLVTGSSLANFIALLVARHQADGEIRARGLLNRSKMMTACASAGTHGCLARAMDMAGLGAEQLRRIPVDDHFRIDMKALEQAIETDRREGNMPFCVIGNAGTVDVGAIDPLREIAALCRRERLWFHIDGAFGALAMMSPALAPRFEGIEQADSLALDFHKWAQVQYDAGFVLVRDRDVHRAAFAAPAAYLSRESRGLAAGSTWPCDFGPDLSRSFKALKVWFTLQIYGDQQLGRMMEHTCELANELAKQIREYDELELLAPVALNIVCFRYRGPESDRLNSEIVIALQESGRAAPSTTRINGDVAIRAAIFNHRTTTKQLERLIEGVLAHGRRLQESKD